MSEHQTLYVVVGVLVIILLVIAYNNMRMRQEKDAPKGEDGEADDASVSPLLSRFARHEGSVVGETVAVSGGDLILKQAGQFKAVPKSLATLVDDEVVLMGHIDWDQAVAAGTAWKEGNTKGIDPEVTADLTKSEDVRKPALEAMKEKELENVDETQVEEPDEGDNEHEDDDESSGYGREGGEDEDSHEDSEE